MLPTERLADGLQNPRCGFVEGGRLDQRSSGNVLYSEKIVRGFRRHGAPSAQKLSRSGRCKLSNLRCKHVKGYHDIVGDGGSRILEQVVEQRARMVDALAGVRHLVAIGSGKGGVGKSTLTLQLAEALRARGQRVAILDADFNGPSQARMAGVQDAVFVPGSNKVAVPRTASGIGVFSIGSLIPESQALEFDSPARGETHTWRSTREFTLLGEILTAFDWGALDVLLFDLPPGADRTVQYADFLSFPGGFAPPDPPSPSLAGPHEPRSAPAGRDRGAPVGAAKASFVLVTIPSEVARGVVARSIAALSKGSHRVLGYIENMSGYYCRDCKAVKPLFVAGETSGLSIPCLGTVPFDPELARHCDAGLPFSSQPDTPVGSALRQIAQRLLDVLDGPKEPTR